MSEYMQKTGINLVEKAFEQVTDEQISTVPHQRRGDWQPRRQDW
jgi:hypothetical protein